VNLIGNAIKFTGAGEVRVRLDRPDLSHWAIVVSDTGPGLAKEAQTYIFEPFRQVDGSLTRVHGGAGLGLSIVKQLVDLMEGQIIVESEIGRGSTFTVLLPLIQTLQGNTVIKP
jgi:signal transduction histidine kinase